MESVQKAHELSQSDENSRNMDVNEQNWNCVTSQAFLKSYIQYLMKIDAKKDANGVKTENKSKKDENRRFTRSAGSKAKRLKLDCENVPTGEHQLSTIIKTNDWHQKLCKCSKCLTMYQDYNIEFLFFVKNIEWLPTEILLKIFTPLLPSDRRVASETCKRFLDIWLCDEFINDRRLVLDKCVLDPKREPLSIFLQSQRNYQHLVFGNVVMNGESEFAGKFGETVTTVELHEDFNSKSFNISSFLLQLPNLKTFKVDNFDQLKYCSELPTTIQLLVISGRGFMPPNLSFSELKSSYLDKTSDSFRIELNNKISARNILDLTDQQRSKIQGLNLCIWHQSDYVKLPLFENLKYLNIFFEEKEPEYQKEILNNLEEQCPRLQELAIEMPGGLPHKNWTFLKQLETGYIPKAELPRLSIFENLEKLSFESDREWFFVHEAFQNMNLKTLDIDRYLMLRKYAPCITRFGTMIESFPGLENFKFNGALQKDHLKFLATKTPKLKYLELGSIGGWWDQGGIAPRSLEPKTIKTWPFMLNLRKIKLKLEKFDSKTVKMFAKMPALEDLDLYCKTIGDDLVTLFDTMSKSLKRLKKIRFHCWNANKENYPKIVDVMAKNCKFLQHIDLPFVFKPDEVWKQNLQEHSSIRLINGVWLK